MLEMLDMEIGVVHSPVIKPLDAARLLREAEEALHHNQRIIPAENHSITGE